MKISLFIFFLGLFLSGFAQVDRDQLSLEISKAEAANLEKLKPYLWRRETVVTVDGQVKTNALSEMNFDETGKLSVKTGKPRAPTKINAACVAGYRITPRKMPWNMWKKHFSWQFHTPICQKDSLLIFLARRK